MDTKEFTGKWPDLSMKISINTCQSQILICNAGFENDMSGSKLENFWSSLVSVWVIIVTLTTAITGFKQLMLA